MTKQPAFQDPTDPCFRTCASVTCCDPVGDGFGWLCEGATAEFSQVSGVAPLLLRLASSLVRGAGVAPQQLPATQRWCAC